MGRLALGAASRRRGPVSDPFDVRGAALRTAGVPYVYLSRPLSSLLVPLEGKTAPEVRAAFAREITTLPAALKRSLTYDQGKEMSEHRHFTEETDVTVYFAHPHSPWERGTSENTNGLLRQFFPKGTDFRQVSRAEIRRVQDLMNGRPRKTLDFRTPAEVFSECLLHC